MTDPVERPKKGLNKDEIDLAWEGTKGTWQLVKPSVEAHKDIEEKQIYMNATNMFPPSAEMTTSKRSLQKPEINESLLDLLNKYFPSEASIYADDVESEKTPTKSISTKVTKKADNSKKKRQEAAKLAEDQEKEEALTFLKRKYEDMKRIKLKYNETARTYRCKLHENQRTESRRKSAYVKKLAKALDCDPKTLEPFRDVAYRNHKQLKAEVKRKNLELVEKNLKWIETVLDEERFEEIKKVQDKKANIQLKKKAKMEKKKEEERSKSLGRVLSEIKRQSEEPEIQKIEEPEAATAASKRKSAAARSRSFSTKGRKSMAPKRKSMARKSLARRLPGSARISKLSRGSKDSLKESFKPRPGLVYDPVKPVSVLDPKLIDMFDQLQKQKDLELVPAPTESSTSDPNFMAYPATVVFNNYYLGKTYSKKVKLMNLFDYRADCRPHEIRYTPIEATGVIEVEPWVIQSSLPGISPFVNIKFTPVEGLNKFDAEVVFMCRRPPSTEWKPFSLHVSCIPPLPQLTVTPRLIQLKSWSKNKSVRYLTVINDGDMPCTLVISRNQSSELNDGTGPDKAIKHKIHIRTFVEYEGEDSDEMDNILKSNFAINQRLIINEHLKPMQSVANLAAEAVVKDVIEDVLQVMFEVYPWHGLYLIEIKGRTTTKVPISFGASNSEVGTQYEKWNLVFNSYDDFSYSQDLDLVGVLEPSSLYVEPAILDFKICTVGHTQQDSFIVGNQGKTRQKFNLKLPKCMTPHASVECPIQTVPSGGQVKVLVRLNLKSSFMEEVKYYDEPTNILDFPIMVCGQDKELFGPPLEVRVMACITMNMGLEIFPEIIDFGPVYTYQTVVAPFHIANRSLVTHHFAFLNLPKWAMIQPNYGFGTIAPGEKIQLELLYSPSIDEVPHPGGTSDHYFVLICSTMDRLANRELALKQDITDEKQKTLTSALMDPMMSEKQDFEDTSYSRDEITPVSEDEDKEDDENEDTEAGFDMQFNIPMRITNALVDNHQNEFSKKSKKSLLNRQRSPDTNEKKVTFDPAASGRMENDGEAREEKEVILPIPQSETVDPLPPGREEEPIGTYLGVRAKVVDPLFVLSAQKVFPPATPYYSYSISQIELRCNDFLMDTGCYCPKNLSKPNAKWKGTFEFFSNYPDLEVEPKSGFISSDQKEIKVYLILKPKILDRDIILKAREIRAFTQGRQQPHAAGRTHGQYKMNARKSMKPKMSMKPDVSRRKSRAPSSSKRSTIVTTSKSGPGMRKSSDRHGPSEKNVFYSDLHLGKMSLLRSCETTRFVVRVVCRIDVAEEETDDTRTEVLQCLVYCTVVRPDVVVLTPPALDQTINFGPTMIGYKKKETMYVYNTSDRPVIMSKSPLQNSEDFYCPLTLPLDQCLPNNYMKTGICLEPDVCYPLSVYYTPHTEGAHVEYFDIRADRTVIPVKLAGTGCERSFKITPDFVLGRFISADYGVRFTITIENRSAAELRFKLIRVYMKEWPAEITPVVKPFLSLSEKILPENLIHTLKYDATDVDPIICANLFTVPESVTVPAFGSHKSVLFFNPVVDATRRESSKSRSQSKISSRASSSRRKSSAAGKNKRKPIPLDPIMLGKKFACKVRVFMGTDIVAQWWFVGHVDITLK